MGSTPKRPCRPQLLQLLRGQPVIALTVVGLVLVDPGPPAVGRQNATQPDRAASLSEIMLRYPPSKSRSGGVKVPAGSSR
jgi:hypothetical protein